MRDRRKADPMNGLGAVRFGWAKQDLWDRVGRRLQARREQCGLSREELAKKINRTRHAVLKAEDGSSLPLHIFVQMALALDVSLDDLVKE